MDALPTVWFVVIAVLWTGYLLLEGFDLGVGMHMLVRTRREEDRRVMLNTIGPIWDGNEVWLITAGAATFAAFPSWYASLLSTLYIPFVLLLLGLIARAVSIEWRGKVATERWARFWTWTLGLGSFVAAFAVGAALTLTTTGLPIDANGNRVGGPFAWLTPLAILGGLAVVGFCLVHAAVFLALKSDGPVRVRAGRDAVRMLPIALLPMVGWVLVLQFSRGTAVSWALVVVAVVGAVLAWVAARGRREGLAFIGMALFLLAGSAAIFTAAYPVVLPSTLDPAFSLTIANAASSPYTLGVMSVVSAVGLPLVLLYQGWTYWIFRARVTPGHIPPAHVFAPAIKP